MNKFFKITDDRLHVMDDFIVPEVWWSRPYEYAFANYFLESKDIILDAGCGIGHPFKFYAGKRVQKVYAVDSNENILENIYDSNVIPIVSDIKDIPIEDNTVDKVFCISVLEHIEEGKVEILKEFKRVLKDGGKVILTCDYPAVTPGEIISIAESVGLRSLGQLKYNPLDKSNINSSHEIYCFSLVLEA
jgi:ubiquinone/menaquinone biosynthesis C-methylase UbiE